VNAQHSYSHCAEKSENQSTIFERIWHGQYTWPNTAFHQVQQSTLCAANKNQEIIDIVLIISVESENAKPILKLDLT